MIGGDGDAMAFDDDDERNNNRPPPHRKRNIFLARMDDDWAWDLFLLQLAAATDLPPVSFVVFWFGSGS
jgi:hypothetical protein